jgi:hypothetical protein
MNDFLKYLLSGIIFLICVAIYELYNKDYGCAMIAIVTALIYCFTTLTILFKKL